MVVEGREIWLRRISKIEEQQKILYQLQLELPERLEPILDSNGNAVENVRSVPDSPK